MSGGVWAGKCKLQARLFSLLFGLAVLIHLLFFCTAQITMAERDGLGAAVSPLEVGR